MTPYVFSSKAELETHLAEPEVASKLEVFRIVVCLVALVKMATFRVTYLQPDLAIAHRLFDEWEKGPHGMEKAWGRSEQSARQRTKQEVVTCVHGLLSGVIVVVFVPRGVMGKK